MRRVMLFIGTRIPVTAVAMLVLIGSAYANVIFSLGNPGGSMENVLANNSIPGMSIEATTQKSSHLVVFSSTLDTLLGTGGASGVAATGCAAPPCLIHNITITVPGFAFHQILFSPTGNVTEVIARTTDGKTFDFGAFPGGYLNLATSPNELISSVTINSTGGLKDLSQVRFSTTAGEFEEIPEPSTLLTFGTGVLGLTGMLRRKLKRGT